MPAEAVGARQNPSKFRMGPLKASLPDRADRALDPLQPRRELGGQPVALGLAVGRDPVEAPRAALRVLPLARHQAALLERPQQRVHRVRVHGQRASGQRLDALDQLVAVRRPAADVVQDEQRQQPGTRRSPISGSVLPAPARLAASTAARDVSRAGTWALWRAVRVHNAPMPEALDLALELVQLDTINPPGNEHLAAELLATRLEAAGLDVSRHEHGPGRTSVVARWPGTDGRPALCLTGHLDTVPLGGAPWTVEPFGELRDGRLYGRGSTDMKGGVAAIVVAAERVAALGRGRGGPGARAVRR